MTKLLALIRAVLRIYYPDVDTIIANFAKTQAKLEALIGRESAALAKGAQAEAAILIERARRNTAINRAYRVIHRLDELVA